MPSSIRTLSVISSVRRAGSMLFVASAWSTIVSRSTCGSWRAERLTLAEMPASTPPSASHSASWAQARWSTCVPIGTISPVSSAIEMNSPG